LAALKKKHDKADEDSRYNGTILGQQSEPHIIPVEGAEISTLKEWMETVRKQDAPQDSSTTTSRRQSSELSSLGDQDMDGIEF
jgi:transcription initiation factor TFIID subunit 3